MLGAMLVRGRRAWTRLASAVGPDRELATQLLAVGVAQTRTELQEVIEDVVGLEVILAASQVHEAPLFIEDHANAPASLFDGLVTAAALGLSGRGPLTAVDTLEALMRHALACYPFQGVALSDAVGCLLQRL